MNFINFREAPETEASLLFEKREQDRTNANKAFFPSKKKSTLIFFYIFEIRRVNPEQIKKEERENQRERDRAAVLHVTGGELEPAPWRASQMQIGSHKFS